jgi:glyoxalase family protein
MSEASDGILGIHHVTAIASDPQRNVDFYAGVLGLRLVKQTVNFDDPGTYHLYYGDGLGSPGTIMTFFPWPGAHSGKHGTGQTTTTAFSVPSGSLVFWQERLAKNKVEVRPPYRRFDEEVLAFEDHDGTYLELVAHDTSDTRDGWQQGPVPPDAAIRGFHGVTLSEEGYEQTAELLTGGMGFRKIGEAGNRFRFEAGQGGPGAYVDVVCLPEAQAGIMGAGIVHHVAWRAADDERQLQWRARLVDLGYNVTPVMDRQYFHSIYYREPGGVIFEIATDPPGFTFDESAETLGTQLRLPPWLEPQRARLLERLPPLKLPHPAR